MCSALGRRAETCIRDDGAPGLVVFSLESPPKPKRSQQLFPVPAGAGGLSTLLAATLIVSPNSSGRGDFARGLYVENDLSFRR